MIKTFIINRDTVTWPKKMVEDIQAKFPELEPIILDNDSSFKPLLDWYDTEPCRIIRFDQNYGHTCLWASLTFHKELKDDEYFILTDPDFEISNLPSDTIEVLKEGVEKYKVTKAGLAIQIDDLPDEYPLKEQVLIWETPFWKNPIGNYFYNAPIDTTFALHKKDLSRTHTIGGVRLGGPYTVRHLPFYLTPDNITEEIAYYFDNANKAVSSQARYLNQWVQECYKK